MITKLLVFISDASFHFLLFSVIGVESIVFANLSTIEIIALNHLSNFRRRLKAENTSLAKLNDQMTLDLERLLNNREVNTIMILSTLMRRKGRKLLITFIKACPFMF